LSSFSLRCLHIVLSIPKTRLIQRNLFHCRGWLQPAAGIQYIWTIQSSTHIEGFVATAYLNLGCVPYNSLVTVYPFIKNHFHSTFAIPVANLYYSFKNLLTFYFNELCTGSGAGFYTGQKRKQQCKIFHFRRV
jgi:hypothetical protein